MGALRPFRPWIEPVVISTAPHFLPARRDLFILARDRAHVTPRDAFVSGCQSESCCSMFHAPVNTVDAPWASNDSHLEVAGTKGSLDFIMNDTDVSAPQPSWFVTSCAADRGAAVLLIRSMKDNANPTAPVKVSANPSSTKVKRTLSNEEKRRSRECKVDGCKNYIINKGLCFRHGGGKKCSFKDCRSSAKNAGLCWRHGGSVKCIVKGCQRRGKSRGLCWAHGGGTKCSSLKCTKVAVSNGCCWAHGGGKRCAYEGCNKAAYERTHNYCVKHHDQLKDGKQILNV